MKDRTYTIKLNSSDLGQMLDGIEQRALSYRNTEHYHAFGETLSEDIIEEVTDADEARQIAEHYERIMATVRAQLEQQDKERCDLHLHNTSKRLAKRGSTTRRPKSGNSAMGPPVPFVPHRRSRS